MNAKEGVRRIGFVAGVLGAGLGVCILYVQLSGMLAKRAQDDEFRSLFSSPTVQKEVSFLKTGLKNAKDPSPAFQYAHHGQDWFDAVAAVNGSLEGWVVNEGSTGTIYFGADGEVSCISNREGMRRYPGDRPKLWAYLSLLAWPVLGFIIPWGALKAIGWIGAGFVQNPK